MVTEAEREFCFFKLGLAGSFTESLINTAFKADMNNQYRLAEGFPELMDVIMRYQSEREYWKHLVERWNKEFTQHKLSV